MVSGSATKEVWQKWGIFLLQKSRQVIQTPLSHPHQNTIWHYQNTIWHYPLIDIVQLSWGLYKVKLLALRRLCCRVYGLSPSYPYSLAKQIMNSIRCPQEKTWAQLSEMLNTYGSCSVRAVTDYLLGKLTPLLTRIPNQGPSKTFTPHQPSITDREIVPRGHPPT